MTISFSTCAYKPSKETAAALGLPERVNITVDTYRGVEVRWTEDRFEMGTKERMSWRDHKVHKYPVVTRSWREPISVLVEGVSECADVTDFASGRRYLRVTCVDGSEYAFDVIHDPAPEYR